MSLTETIQEFINPKKVAKNLQYRKAQQHEIRRDAEKLRFRAVGVLPISNIEKTQIEKYNLHPGIITPNTSLLIVK